MKTVTVLIASCFAHFSADAFDNSKKTPVGKVITLLKDMISQLEKESEEDEEVYQTMGCWCETNDKEKTQAIAGAEQRILDLTTAIEELGAKSSQLNTEIQNLEEELEKNSEALDSATALRKKQLAEFNEEEKGMLQSISGLKAAVVVMSKKFGESAAYLQDSSVTLGLAAMLDKELRIHQDLLREVITPKQRRLVEAFAKDPDSFLQMHTPTEEIYGVLKQMKESFQTNLAASQREEAENQHAYEELKAAKEDEIFAGRSQVDTKTEELAMTDTKHAQSRQDLEDTQNTLSSDTKFLADLKERCAAVDAEYEMRTKSRQMEIQATSKALEFLSSDEAHELLGRTLALVQRSRSERRTLRSHVASLLHEARRRTGDPRLAALEVHARLDAFGKIKDAVQGMIDMLIEEKDDEMKHRDFCIDALNTNERDTENKERDKSDMEAKIKDLKMSLDETTKAIEELTAEIDEMQVQMKRAGEDREKENRDFQLTIADQRATKKLLGAALGVLKGFYDKAALLQQEKSAVAVSASQRQAQAPPSFKPMEKSAAGGGVMGMIQNIIRDASAMEAEALRAEEDSQKGYVEFARNTNDSIEESSKNLLNKGEEKAKLEQELVESKEGAATILQEMEQLFNSHADLHKSCDFILKNFEDRTTARDSEVEALKESLAMFSGASFGALLQGHALAADNEDDMDEGASGE